MTFGMWDYFCHIYPVLSAVIMIYFVIAAVGSGLDRHSEGLL